MPTVKFYASLRQVTGTREADIKAETIKELGFDGIEATVRKKGHVLPERVEDDLPRLVEALQKHDLEVTEHLAIGLLALKNLRVQVAGVDIAAVDLQRITHIHRRLFHVASIKVFLCALKILGLAFVSAATGE